MDVGNSLLLLEHLLHFGRLLLYLRQPQIIDHRSFLLSFSVGLFSRTLTLLFIFCVFLEVWWPKLLLPNTQCRWEQCAIPPSLYVPPCQLCFSHTRVPQLAQGSFLAHDITPFSLEIQPTQPFPDTRFDSSSTFCFALIPFEHQSILSSLFLQFVKVFESFSCSLRALAAPLSSVLSADAASLLHIPLPKSLMKILSNTRPCTDPCGAVPKPSFHFDNKQPIAFPYAFPAGLVPHSVSPPPYSPTLLLGTPYETVSKTLLQTRRIASPGSPLSETCCPVTGKLDWFDMIYSWENHGLWSCSIPVAHAMPCLWIWWEKLHPPWRKGDIQHPRRTLLCPDSTQHTEAVEIPLR